MNPIPLSLRVPNPPAVFVGREAALSAWVAAARRGLVVVTGPQGIGKTALLLHALHKTFARRLDLVRYVRVGTGTPAEAVLQALLAGKALRGEDWAGLLADPDAAAAAALDQAEAQEAWLVLDADGAPCTEALLAWIHAVARFARRSQWFITTRTHVPEDDLLRGQVVPLAGLPEAELRTLAKRVAPTADAPDVAWALHVAGGSPGWFRQALTAEASDRESQRNDLKSKLIPALAPADAEALLALAVAEVPLPACALSPEARSRLQEAGWLEVGPAGVQVASVPRAQLAAVTPPDAWRRACAQTAARLADQPSRIHALEALRLWLAARTDQAAAWLDQVGDSLVAGGYAGRLWALLEPHTRPELEGWRLRAAVEAGLAASLPLQPPTTSSWTARFEWARVLGQRGELAAAVAWADALRAECAPVGDKHAELSVLAQAALLLSVRCRMNMGQLEGALALLEAHPSADVAAAALATTCRLVLGHPGALAEARALAEAQRLTAPDTDALRARLPIALMFYRVGRLREAEAVFDLLLQGESMAPVALLRPEIAFVHFAVRLARGQLDEAGRHLERTRSQREDSLWGLPTAVGAVALRIARGDLAEIAADIERLRQVALERSRFEFAQFALSLHEDVARLLAQDLPTTPDGPGAGPYYTTYLALHRARRRVRAGQLATPPTLEHPDCQTLEHLVDADRALASAAEKSSESGELSRIAAASGLALTAAQDALARAREHGFALHEAEALELLADACLVAGAWTTARQHAEALAALAAAMASPRFVAEARWRMLAAAPTPDFAGLEHLAAGAQALPAVRRARALLGAVDVPLDCVDVRVLAAVQARPGWASPAPRGPWRPAFGVQVAHQRAWLPDGTWVDFQGRPQLWKLLVTLLDGEADKETLVRGVWQEPDYHPLRHDNRLHATVRNLRIALGDTDPPTRLFTTEAGYRLAPGVRRC